MKKTLGVLVGAAFLTVACGTENTRNRTTTQEQTRKAGAEAMNTRGTGEDKDLVGTDSKNSPWKHDVDEGKQKTDQNKKNSGKQ